MTTFRVDISTLSALTANYVETPLQEHGTSIQLEWEQGGADQDIQLHGYAIRAVRGESMATDAPATASGTFILDISRLEGLGHNFVSVPLEGRGRSIQIEWSQPGANQDMQLLGYSVRAVKGETMSQEPA